MEENVATSSDAPQLQLLAVVTEKLRDVFMSNDEISCPPRFQKLCCSTAKSALSSSINSTNVADYLETKVIRYDQETRLLVLSDGRRHCYASFDSPTENASGTTSTKLLSSLPVWLRVTDCEYRILPPDNLLDLRVFRIEPLGNGNILPLSRRDDEVLLTIPLGMIGQLEVNGDKNQVLESLEVILQRGLSVELEELLRWSPVAREYLNDTIPAFKASPLHVCAYFGHTECIRVLLQQNGVTTGEGSDGQYKEVTQVDAIKPVGNSACTPFYIACQQGHLGVVKLLLNMPEGAGMASCWPMQQPIGRDAPMASSNGHATHSYRDSDQSPWWSPERCELRCWMMAPTSYTPLDIAVESNRPNIVRFLLDRAEQEEASRRYGTHIQPRRDYPQYLIHPLVTWACAGGFTSTLRELLRPRGPIMGPRAATDVGSGDDLRPPFDPDERSREGLPALCTAVNFKFDANSGSDSETARNGTTTTATNTFRLEAEIRYELVRILLEAGAEPDAPMSMTKAHTTLYLAAQRGEVAVVRLLATYGARIEAVPVPLPTGSKDCSGWCALDNAADLGQREVVRCLIGEFGVKATIMSLIVASASGDEIMLAQLLSSRFRAGEPYDEHDSCDDTTLASPWRLPMATLTAYVGNYRASRLSTSPLRAAAAHGHAHIIRLLLNHNATTRRVTTPTSTFHGAASSRVRTRLSEDEVTLMTTGSGVQGAAREDAGSREGIMVVAPTAVHVAVVRGQVDALQVLLEMGADASGGGLPPTEGRDPDASLIPPEDEDSPLVLACRLGRSCCQQLVRLLLQFGADAGVAGHPDRAVPVLLSTLRRDEATVRLLINGLAEREHTLRVEGQGRNDDSDTDGGVECDIVTMRRRWLDTPLRANGFTALILACSTRQSNVALALVAAGADRKPHDTLNASDVAAASGAAALAIWLRQSSYWTSPLHFASTPLMTTREVLRRLQCDYHHKRDGTGDIYGGQEISDREGNNAGRHSGSASLRWALNPNEPFGGLSFPESHVLRVSDGDNSRLRSSASVAASLLGSSLPWSRLGSRARQLRARPASAANSAASTTLLDCCSIADSLRLVVDAGMPWSLDTHRQCWPLPLRQRVRFLLLVCNRLAERLGDDNEVRSSEQAQQQLQAQGQRQGQSRRSESGALLAIFVQWVLPAAMDRPTRTRGQ